MYKLNAADMSELTGLKRKTFDQWVQRGLILPSHASRGAGTSAEFDEDRLFMATLLQILKRYGVPLRRAAEIVRDAWLQHDFKDLIGDGSVVFVISIGEDAVEPETVKISAQIKDLPSDCLVIDICRVHEDVNNQLKEWKE